MQKTEEKMVPVWKNVFLQVLTFQSVFPEIWVWVDFLVQSFGHKTSATSDVTLTRPFTLKFKQYMTEAC